jgi:hypothetical protein
MAARERPILVGKGGSVICTHPGCPTHARRWAAHPAGNAPKPKKAGGKGHGPSLRFVTHAPARGRVRLIG